MAGKIRRGFILFLMGLLLLFSSGCIFEEEVTQDPNLIDAQVYEPETVYIGAALPSDITDAYYIQSAWDTATDFINNAQNVEWEFARSAGIGNYGAAKVQLVYGESYRTPADAARVGETLANLGVVSLVGAYEDSFTAAIANRIRETGLVMVSGAPDDPLLTDGQTYQFGDGFFRIAPTPEMEMDLFFNGLKNQNQTQNAQIATVALAYEDNAAGRQILEAFNAKAEEYGMEVVARIAYTPGLTSVAAEVQKMIANQPDVIVQASDAQDLLLFLKAYAASRYEPELLFCYGSGFQEPEVAHLTEELEMNNVCGILFTPLLRSNALTVPPAEENTGVTTDAETGAVQQQETVAALEFNETFAVINQLFRDRANRDMRNDELLEFASVMVIAQVIGENGTADRETMKETLRNQEIPAPYLESGVIAFDENGQNTVNPGYLAVIRDGRYLKL